MPNQSLKQKLNQTFANLKPKKKPAKTQKAPQENKPKENKNEKSKKKFKMPKMGAIFQKENA